MFKLINQKCQMDLKKESQQGTRAWLEGVQDCPLPHPPPTPKLFVAESFKPTGRAHTYLIVVERDILDFHKSPWSPATLSTNSALVLTSPSFILSSYFSPLCSDAELEALAADFA